MLTMDQIHTIRELYFNQGQSVTTIAAKVGCDWRTVRKYVDQEDFSPQQPKPESQARKGSKLDPYKPTIDQWLRDDMKSPRKQRHTARKIFDRLHDVEGFDCSYHLVTDYVAKKKEDLNLKKSNGHLPLIHSQGEAQVDFGTASYNANLDRSAEECVWCTTEQEAKNPLFTKVLGFLYTLKVETRVWINHS